MQKEAWGQRFVLKNGNQGLESKSNSTAVKKSLASKKGNKGLELRRNIWVQRKQIKFNNCEEIFGFKEMKSRSGAAKKSWVGPTSSN